MSFFVGTTVTIFYNMFLIAVRKQVKTIDNSVVGFDLICSGDLKCMFMLFNILLYSQINISLRTDLIFTDHLFIC